MLEGLGPFETVSERFAVQVMKEKYAFLKMEGEEEKRGGDDDEGDLRDEEYITHQLPDHREIYIPSSALSTCAKVLFQPSLLGIDPAYSLTKVIGTTVDNALEDVRPLLFGNIVLCGGTAKLRGLLSYLIGELALHLPEPYTHHLRVSLFPPEEHLDSVVWRGGAAIVSTGSDAAKWIPNNSNNNSNGSNNGGK